jgi:anti-anti-sigma regulatory factor
MNTKETTALEIEPTGPGFFTVRGELTTATVRELQVALLDCIKAGAGVAVDLFGVTRIDAAGVELLIAAQRAFAGAGLKLSWMGQSGAVEDALQVLAVEQELSGPGAVIWG